MFICCFLSQQVSDLRHAASIARPERMTIGGLLQWWHVVDLEAAEEGDLARTLQNHGIEADVSSEWLKIEDLRLYFWKMNSNSSFRTGFDNFSGYLSIISFCLPLSN